MTLREELEGIYEAHGRLTPALLVDTARTDEHPLHDRFEWDNSIAGEKYRRVQAAELIRSVKVIYKAREPEDDDKVRAFHAVSSVKGRTYMPVEEIATNEFTRELVLRTAEREWRALYKRYQHLSEFLGMIRGDIAS